MMMDPILYLSISLFLSSSILHPFNHANRLQPFLQYPIQPIPDTSTYYYGQNSSYILDWTIY
jgi:hypothetical protein